MKRVFGKKKETGPAPSLDETSSNLNGRIEGLDGKIAGLEAELRKYKEQLKQAKSPAAKKQWQKRAMDVLKRKRMYEQQRDTIMGQQFNIDQAAFGIESAKATVDTVAAMKAASNQLKVTLKKDLNMDDIDDIADDMAELMEDMNMINEELGRNFATPDDIDEADLDAELELLGDELEEEAEATPDYLLPATPNDALEDPNKEFADQIPAVP